MTEQVSRSKTKRFRWLWFSMGWLCFGIGLAGVPIPGLPTTPFMLLALWGFSKSSARFERRLLEHRTLGPPLRDWNERRVVSRRAKRLAWATMAVALGFLLLFERLTMAALAGAFMLAGVVVLSRFPSQ